MVEIWFRLFGDVRKAELPLAEAMFLAMELEAMDATIYSYLIK